MPRRRSFLAAASAVAGAAVTTRAPLGALASGLAQSAPPLIPFPAHTAPFDAAGRRFLAEDLLTFFVKQKGLFPGRDVYLLPAAPWFGGWEPAATQMAWDLTVTTGQPLYLMAAADPSGALDAAG